MKFFIIFLFFVITLVKSHTVVADTDVAYTDIAVLQDYNKWTTAIRSLLDNNTLSTECSKQFDELFKNGQADLWNFFDATSKFPWSGLAVGSYADFGNYPQCMQINHIYSGGRIQGKYCVFGLAIPSLTADLNNINSDDFFKLSVCMPDACSAEDFNKIIILPLFNDQQCHTQDDVDRYTPGDKAILIVLSIFGIILAVSTSYDVYLVKTGKKSAHPLFLAFSVYTNSRKIIATSKKHREQIQIFNGIKSISIAWIIAGHGFNGWLINVANNDYVKKEQRDISFFYASGAQMSVDSFFFMSGFLLAYLYMKQKNKPLSLQLKSLPYSILHRYIRLTPALAMVYFFQTTIIKHMNDTPVYYALNQAVIKTCHTHWLSFFFYLQNYVNYDDVCVIPSWYLSADMQLFIIANIILIPLSVILAKSNKNFKLVMGICWALNILFTVLPLAARLIWTEYDNPYDTHSRIIDYSIGIMMGIYIRETSSKYLVKSKILNFVIWTIVLISMGACVVLYQELVYSLRHSHTVQSLYYSFSKPIWCLGLSWITYSCYHGYGGIVNWILSRPILQITAKLSYCMYLVHGIVLTLVSSQFSTKISFSHYNAFKLWCAFFIVTLGFSFIWTLTFESPLVIVEKFVFGGGRASSKKGRQSNNNNKESKTT
ncbi:nose resistant to fluoxetine protein 6-like [Diabrotica undecimpunctata]|uniref:nose resistant to fluoxetine protein 6-like n=1 Tax=Diabrotica undecimpunctata TaxID=50387 RepID=UPI003B6416A5